METNNCKKNHTIIAMDCLCVDVYEASNEMCAGGEALNFAAVASQYDADIKLLGAVGNDRFGAAVMESIKNKRISRELIHIVDGVQTAHHIISLTENGDRYFKDGAWHGGIYETYKLTDTDKQAILAADYVFTTYSSPNFVTLLNLRRQGTFRLAVDFNDTRQLDIPDSTLTYIDIFFISGEEKILPKLKEWSEQYDNIFNATLAENGSVTYFKGKEYRVSAVPVDKVIDTTGCGDSYHAGFLCTYLKTADITQAMNEGSRSAAHTLSHYGGFD